ncbi:hypothetical protein [Sinorhizobium meliloti]|uniref:hypothetical protein n=1 Tax=Rhizobium meliloti TaxID=382 RepID=UPI0002861962|nr:hypothetical protein [Sinorhizobium meliloti]ASP83085.1 cyclohexanone monooxygenase [Sinorhizobium meliloti]MQW20060.1 cyclohexanone monooxygenase [Sinorhizobium meliloti]CCM69604.1 hypothetical protein BN406_06667 [Sinorhizobium meliloti Rm41]
MCPSKRASIITGEQNVDFVSDLIGKMEEQGLDRVEAASEALATWMVHVAEVVAGTLYRGLQSQCLYTGRNVPGKKAVFMPYAGGAGIYESVAADVIGVS